MNNSWNRAACTSLVAASLLLLAACGQQVDTATTGHPHQSGTLTEPTAAGDRGTPMAVGVDTSVMGGAPAPVALSADDRVTAEVRSALASDSDLGALKIDVQTQGGVVTLRGAAPDPAAKERAGDLAKAMKDVKSVDNQLTLG